MGGSAACTDSDGSISTDEWVPRTSTLLPSGYLPCSCPNSTVVNEPSERCAVTMAATAPNPVVRVAALTTWIRGQARDTNAGNVLTVVGKAGVGWQP